jgi:hypothetical protein
MVNGEENDVRVEEEANTAEKRVEPNVPKAGSADMGSALAKVGVRDFYDFLCYVAGLLAAMTSIFDLIKFFLTPFADNYWVVIFYGACTWTFINAAMAAKFGPWLASKFKKVSSAFSFLTDEVDAKNYVVVIGAWTVIVNIFVSGNDHAGTVCGQGCDWEIFVYLAALVLFAIYLLKGKLQKK